MHIKEKADKIFCLKEMILLHTRSIALSLVLSGSLWLFWWVGCGKVTPQDFRFWRFAQKSDRASTWHSCTSPHPLSLKTHPQSHESLSPHDEATCSSQRCQLRSQPTAFTVPQLPSRADKHPLISLSQTADSWAKYLLVVVVLLFLVFEATKYWVGLLCSNSWPK